MYEFYVGTTPKDPPGNIVKVCLDSDGQLVDKSYYEAVSPAYLCRKGSCIYAVIENADFGGVQVFDVNKNGSLTAKARLDTEDVYSTYISAEKRGNRIFVANYGTPSCAVYRYEAEKLVQESVLREKKTEKSHIHCAALTPEEAYVCLVDVGTDEILVYAADSLELVDTVKFPEGSGPRHIVFSSKGSYAYVITESSSEVFLMAYTPEQERKLVILGSNSTEPVGFGGAAGIRISPGERFVLASNRNADSISVFQIRENGWLRLVYNEIVPCGCPRDFQFTPDGKWVIAGLQTTDRLLDIIRGGKQMKEIVIPKTELKVSALCLGGGPHGVDPEESEKVLDYYLASGGNFIDTANIYGQWKPGGGVSVSERFLGKYIKSRKCRNRIVLDTKGAAPHFDTMHVPRVSRKDILHDIDDSLKNLQVDYVDLYWLHHDDEKISVEEIIDTLVALVREGKIRYFGCSNWNTARIREALDYSRKKKIPEFVGNQVMYNLAKYNQERLDQEIMFGMTSEMYALHKKEGLAVMCYSSQAQGYFSCADKEDFMENPVYDNPGEFYENEISRLRLKKVKVLAKKYQCDPTQIALKYMLCKDAFPTIPIIGSGRLSEVKLSIEAMGIPLTKEECEYLENDAKE